MKKRPLISGNYSSTHPFALGVNFTNILCAAFSYESFARSFFELEVKVKLFIGAKKMLVKLTLGLSEKRHINGTIAQFLSL